MTRKNYRVSNKPALYSRGEDGHVHVTTRAVSSESRIYDHINKCTSTVTDEQGTHACEVWSYKDEKAERHMKRKKAHVVIREET
jgi:hypothetical protein